MEVSRRQLLKLGAAAGVAAALPIVKFRGAGAGGDASAKPNSPAFEPFTLPLGIPADAVASGTAVLRYTTDMVPRYDIYQRPVLTEMLPGFLTPVTTYTQDPTARRVAVGLGPTFHTRRGRPGTSDGAIVVRHINRTGVDTSCHLHGGLIDSQDDGHPVLGVIHDGGTRDHSYQNDQIAATEWYHDHALDRTSFNVYHGLAGFYVHSDAFEQSLNLPAGRFDIPLVIQDRAFNADGTLFYQEKTVDQPARQGAFGDVICVNAKAVPRLEVERRKYRFRVLNGSNARIYDLRLSTGDGFLVIGSEHSFLPQTIETDHLFMATAERYNIIIDFSKYRAGTRVVLMNDITPDPYGDPVDGEKVRNIMAFDVVEATGKDNSSTEVTMHPGVMKNFDENAAVATRDWVFARNNGFWTVNGLTFEEGRIDAHPRRNTVELWHMVNQGGGWLHPAHPHLIKARIIDRKPGGVRPWETGLKDVVSVGANEEATMVIWFDAPDNFTSAHGPALYPFHCHNVDHEDHDMMSHWRLEP